MWLAGRIQTVHFFRIELKFNFVLWTVHFCIRIISLLVIFEKLSCCSRKKSNTITCRLFLTVKCLITNKKRSISIALPRNFQKPSCVKTPPCMRLARIFNQRTVVSPHFPNKVAHREHTGDTTSAGVHLGVRTPQCRNVLFVRPSEYWHPICVPNRCVQARARGAPRMCERYARVVAYGREERVNDSWIAGFASTI